jgi:hypothetical protein
LSWRNRISIDVVRLQQAPCVRSTDAVGAERGRMRLLDDPRISIPWLLPMVGVTAA